MSHRMVQHPFTTRVLELLHMDLMGPMQVESLRRKKTCIMLNDKEHVSNFEVKNDEGIFMRCTPNRRAYKVFNRRTKMIME